MAGKDLTIQPDAPVPALVTLSENWDELAEVFRENIGAAGQNASPFVLPRLRVPAGGITGWQDNNGEIVRSVRGIIAYKSPWRGYWPGEFGGKEPPQCSSSDGVVGIGDPGGECNTCTFNKWKSDPKNGRGKACKEMRAVFFINDDAPAVPTLVVLPPSSIAAFDQAMYAFAGKGLLYWKFYVELALKKAQNADGIEYGELVLKELGRIPKEQEQVVRNYRELIAPFTESIIIADYMVDEDENTIVQ